jgi:N-acetylglucosaminyl-diphospho-decaprenol L-rhamnosyltransferase
MVDLAVIIVSWNTKALVIQAVESLLADLLPSGLQAQVVVVDSASADGTPQALRSAFPSITVIESQTNLGFAAANNRGLRHLGFGTQSAVDLPRAVYFLNPDTITLPAATQTLYDGLFRDPQIGLVAPRLQYGDGSFQDSAFGFPGLRQLWVELFPVPGRLVQSRFNGRYPQPCYDQAQPFAVDCILGAAMLMRSEVIQQTGLFDEAYFMYCEEIDWAWRIRGAGWQIQCVPTARVTHLAGQSSSQVRPQSLINLWKSRLILFRKHYSPLKFWIARQMIQVGMRRKINQLAASSLSHADRQTIQVAYETVIEMARQ